jgi:hypothetical protein
MSKPDESRLTKPELEALLILYVWGLKSSTGEGEEFVLKDHRSAVVNPRTSAQLRISSMAGRLLARKGYADESQIIGLNHQEQWRSYTITPKGIQRLLDPALLFTKEVLER